MGCALASRVPALLEEAATFVRTHNHCHTHAGYPTQAEILGAVNTQAQRPER